MITVLDASAVLAFLQGEPGQDVVGLALQHSQCVVNAANHAEIISKALDRGVNPEVIHTILGELNYTVVEIQAPDGERAGLMRADTRSQGLSLGDRLCLATAQRLKAVVLTADRPWLALNTVLELDIRCIRPNLH